LLFLRSALGLSLVAAAIGGGIALGVIHTLASMMPFLPPCSPWVILPIAGLVFAVAMVSSWIPALRSTRVDLSAALRSE
jgi:ABC-type antimicrobial peptide transport system permease subunit